MIIKGKSVAHARDHARHLMRIDQNDRIEILELDVTAAAPTIEAALVEYQTLAEHLTHASKGLYIAAINPRGSEQLNRDQWTRAVNILEKEMGLIGHPRVVILHEKDGREHVHIVWQRAMTHERKVWDDGQNYAKHERAARKIEQVFSLEPTPGKHSRGPGEPLPDPANRQKEEQQASRAGYSLKDLQAEVKEYFNNAETGRGFVTRLEEKGFYLARGDKGNHFMIVTPQGDTKRLQSVLKGISGKVVKEKLFPLVPDKLQTASEIQAAMQMPEQAVDEAKAIHDLFDGKASELRETQALARSRLEAHHRLDNEQVRRERAHTTGFYKLFQNIYGLSWFRNRLHNRADRERLSEQRQVLEALKREQLNARQALDQEGFRAIAELDRKTRGDPGARSRFQVNRAKTLLHHVQDQARAVARHTEKNTRLQDINQYLDWFRKQDRKYQDRQGRYEAIEADAQDSFAKLYQDGKAACDAYRELARKETLPKAVSVLETKPERFGEVNPWGRKREEQDVMRAVAIKAIRRLHYMETKLRNEHKRTLEKRQNVRKMQEEKLRILTTFSDERLALMHGLQQAAIGLSKQDLQVLDVRTRHEIQQARAAFKDSDQGETADRILENQERILTPEDPASE